MLWELVLDMISFSRKMLTDIKMRYKSVQTTIIQLYKYNLILFVKTVG